MSVKQQSTDRTSAVTRNIIFSSLLKGASILLSLLIVPLTLEYLGTEEYGLWLTITSVVAWLAFFDIGLGNGLRNNLTECLANRNYALGREYISTTYTLLGIIIAGFYLLFIISSFWLKWDVILNTHGTENATLAKICYIVFTGFCVKLLLDIINVVLIADHKIYITNVFNLVINILTYLAVYLIIKSGNNHSLVSFCFWYSLIPVVTGIGASLVLYGKKYKSLRPSLGAVNFNHSRKLLSLGFQFFFIQLIVLVIFSTDNLLITQLFGPAEVPAFNIAFKYFSVVTVGFNIILAPFWSAFTDAFVNGDDLWIKKVVRKLVRFWFLLTIGTIIMLICSTTVYRLWVGEEIHISFLTSLSIAAFVLISCWNNIFTYFLNGVSKIRLQLYVCILIGIVNIPLAILLSKIDGLGVSAIAISNCVCLSIGAIVAPLQYYKIVNKKAKGIWNK